MVTLTAKSLTYTPKSISKAYSPTFMGLSTDEKPTDTGENSLFWELDTGKLYYYANDAWNEYGGEAAVGIQMI